MFLGHTVSIICVLFGYQCTNKVKNSRNTLGSYDDICHNIHNHPLPPIDIRRKLNVDKTFRRHPGHLLNVLRTFNLCPVSTEAHKKDFPIHLILSFLQKIFF